MKKMIKLGMLSNCPRYGDYDKYKSCHFCKNFHGYGLHWIAGKCEVEGCEISLMEYSSKAKACNNFDCKEYLIAYVD